MELRPARSLATRKEGDEEDDAEPFVLISNVSKEQFVFDGHNDLALRASGDSDLQHANLHEDQSGRLMTDLGRLKQGQVGAQFWSVYVPCNASFNTLVEQTDMVRRIVKRYSDALQLAWSYEEVMYARHEGKLASLMGMEGAGPLNGSLALLRTLPLLGVRYVTLAHSCSNAWAASNSDPSHPSAGLSNEGKEAIHEMNRLALLVDLSHTSPLTMHTVLAVARAPVIFSHSNAYTVCNHSRNVPDDVLAQLPVNGGVVMVNFMPPYVSQRLLNLQRSNATAAEQNETLNAVGVPDIVAHIEHIARVAGKQHVGFGADLDGFSSPAPALNSVAVYPHIEEALRKRGWAKNELGDLMSGNILRVMRVAEEVAKTM